MTEYIIPMLQDLWNFISTSIIPLLGSLAQLVTSVLSLAWDVWWSGMQNRVLPVLNAIWAFIDKNLMPIFKTLADVLKNVLGAAFRWVQENVFQPLIDALMFIKGLVDDIIDTIRRMKNALAGVKLPGASGDIGGRAAGGPVAAMTPYVVGERGPELFVPDVSGMIVPDNRQTREGNTFNLYVTTTSPAEDVVADFGMLSAMAV
jgi:hypothetical protein